MKYGDEPKAPSSRQRNKEGGGLERLQRAGASAAQAEDLMRRARTEVAAEAGAGYGRVSLEAMYLFPTEFTTAYQRLFLQALKESPGRGGEPNPVAKPKPRLLRKGEPNQKVVVRDETGRDTGERVQAEVLDRDPDRGGGSARGGGKRHRDHWIVKDERALRLKTSVDRELRELAELISRAAGKGGRLDGSPQCPGCRRFLRVTWKFCPFCGTRGE